jgi:glycosyltransferase involved in cell wall biosynthesis
VEGRKSIKNQNQKVTGLCLVFPRFWRQPSKAVGLRLADLIQLVEPSAEEILVMTSRDVAQELNSKGSPFAQKVQFVGNVKCSDSKLVLFRIPGELRAQLQICRNLISISDKIDVIFWRGRVSTFVLPLLLARLKGKKSVLFVESRPSQSVRKMHKGPLGIGGFSLSQILKVIETIDYSLSDRLVADFPGLLNQPWLARYKNKVFPHPTPIRFVSPEFKILTPLNQRRTIVGYIGRMSQEKGVLNFVKAIPLICSQINEVEFFLGGGGPLLHQVENELDDLISQGKVKVLDWIPHNELPAYLNQMKLLVFPSSQEGLGVVVLEAMACGTPVLATPVGGVLDTIIEGKTGFIMEDNSPECIIKNVMRALRNPELDKISEKGHTFVNRDYSYAAMKEKWHKLLATFSAE